LTIFLKELKLFSEHIMSESNIKPIEHPTAQQQELFGPFPEQQQKQPPSTTTIGGGSAANIDSFDDIYGEYGHGSEVRASTPANPDPLEFLPGFRHGQST
jgi:hypothetical protein